MLDIKLLRDRPDEVRQAMVNRNANVDIDEILSLDASNRELAKKRTELQAESNSIGKQVGAAIKGGADPKGEEVAVLRQKGADLKGQVSEIEGQEKELQGKLEALLLAVPNPAQAVVPVGASEDENVEQRVWGDEFKPQHEVMAHDDVAEALGLLDIPRAVKVAQSRFIALKGKGAALERALVNFMLDRHINAGYTEVMPPLLVNSPTLQGTGQLPKFADDSFKCQDDDLWLIPTSEVPLTNLYRDEILSSEQLPLHMTAFTPCFRREAGSYGRDVKGLIRLHQFNKVEMVKIVHPETSEDEHQKLVADAEDILQQLKLPYRVIELCTGDLGFSASRCYDLEVWLPSQNTYREISSCSNCWDFQARRAGIRFKEVGKKGTQYLHTLNGSGLAIGRAMAAILENYQQPDGSVTVPEVLQPFMRCETIAAS
ncbi:MAG: serine--tRNA ligase [Cyanobacteria bacterium P01_E01_bin.34]